MGCLHLVLRIHLSAAPGMDNPTRNARVRIPENVHRALAHLAVDLPDRTVNSLLHEGALLVLAKHGRQKLNADADDWDEG